VHDDGHFEFLSKLGPLHFFAGTSGTVEVVTLDFTRFSLSLLIASATNKSDRASA